jgi:molecular chaperone GrpE
MENTNDEKTNEGVVSENVSESNRAESSSAEDTLVNKISGDEVAKLKNDLGEAKDKYIRLYSEFDNFRKRTAKEKLEMVQSANEHLLKTLLPVVDDFERAEKSFRERDDKELEGFFLIYNKFKKVLEQTGVKVMELGPGSDFNADLHEAITQIPAPDEKLKGKIVDVIEKGYLINEKVIRFAKVVVGS